MAVRGQPQPMSRMMVSFLVGGGRVAVRGVSPSRCRALRSPSWAGVAGYSGHPLWSVIMHKVTVCDKCRDKP